jgi:hypothetical protein
MMYSVLLFEIVLFREKLNISIKQVRITKLASIVSLYWYEERMNGYFWGRTWNLSVPALLRQRVFRPVRARLGAPWVC